MIRYFAAPLTWYKTEFKVMDRKVRRLIVMRGGHERGAAAKHLYLPRDMGAMTSVEHMWEWECEVVGATRYLVSVEDTLLQAAVRFLKEHTTLNMFKQAELVARKRKLLADHVEACSNREVMVQMQAAPVGSTPGGLGKESHPWCVLHPTGGEQDGQEGLLYGQAPSWDRGAGSSSTRWSDAHKVELQGLPGPILCRKYYCL